MQVNKLSAEQKRDFNEFLKLFLWLHSEENLTEKYATLARTSCSTLQTFWSLFTGRHLQRWPLFFNEFFSTEFQATLEELRKAELDDLTEGIYFVQPKATEGGAR